MQLKNMLTQCDIRSHYCLMSDVVAQLLHSALTVKYFLVKKLEALGTSGPVDFVQSRYMIFTPQNEC